VYMNVYVSVCDCNNDTVSRSASPVCVHTLASGMNDNFVVSVMLYRLHYTYLRRRYNRIKRISAIRMLHVRCMLFQSSS